MGNQEPLGLIPDQLLTNIKKGDCVLFLGADLPLGYEGAPLSRLELTTALAQNTACHPINRGPKLPRLTSDKKRATVTA